MHRVYGPIVRISPNEVHIRDEDFYNHLYGSSLKLDKDPWLSNDHPSTMGTASHDLHRLRRGVLNPFFSTQKVAEMQHLIKDKIVKLRSLLERHQKSGSPINMSKAYRAMTMDIVTEYVMTGSFDFLDRKDLGGSWYRMIRNGSASQVLMNQFPWIMPVMQTLPYKLAIWMVPDAEAALGVQKLNEKQIQDIQSLGPDAEYETKGRRPLFHDILFNSTLPPPEKSVSRLGSEATLIVIAGSETVGNALTQLHYQLLSHPDKLARLRNELKDHHVDSSTTWQELRKLPYLTACIDEILRTSHTTTHRLARVAPEGGLQYKQNHLPAGLYLTTAAIHSANIDTKLFKTTQEDIEVAHDFFNGYPKLGSQGVRVTVE
ncbi:MAG: hypothetical protein Q9169_006189 [Polycauliona sp. 2 TL-2023]